MPWQPLWMWFEANGIDVKSMTPSPLHGPPRPETPRLDPRAHLAILQLKKWDAAAKSLEGRWQHGRRHRHARH
jgi:hypothetical protein